MKKAFNISKNVQIGLVALLFFLVVFFIWSLVAELDKASIARGVVIAASNKKTIQHLEGGIVEQILVRQGSYVEKDQPLILLDDVQPKATVDLLTGQAAQLAANYSRLAAERDNKDKISFPEELLVMAQLDDEVAEVLQTQIELFKSNQTTYRGKINIYNQRIKELKKVVETLHNQIDTKTRQLEILAEEIEAVEILEAEDLIGRPTLLNLYREREKIEGERAQLKGNVAKTEQQIGEAELSIIQEKEEKQKRVLENLDKTQEQLYSTLDKLKRAQDTLERTVIVSPIAGDVVDLKVHTVGGVIQPGEKVMDIVPVNDELVIETYISPTDIDVVHPGLEAKVRLTPYKGRKTPTLIGTLAYVTGDILEDPKTGNTFYEGRVIIPQKELSRLNQDVKLYPGMPVEVMIIAEKRTPFDYLTSPIRDSLDRAFKKD